MEPSRQLYACFVPILHYTNCFTSSPPVFPYAGFNPPAPVPNRYYNTYPHHAAASVPGRPLYGFHDQYHSPSPALYSYLSKHAPTVYNYTMSQRPPEHDAVPKTKLKKKSRPYDTHKTSYKVCGNRVSRNKGDRNGAFNIGINYCTCQDLSPSTVERKKHGKLIGNKCGTHH